MRKIGKMSDAELLSIVLRKDASSLLSSNFNLADLSRYVIDDNPVGLTEYQSDILRAVFELGIRTNIENKLKSMSPVIRGSDDCFAQFENLSYLDHEELWAMYLSKSCKILEKRMIGLGGSDSASADVKKIVQPAIRLMASAVVLIHNHPHSIPRPSNQDRSLTSVATQALELFGVKLIDHIIISDEDYYSFRDNGEI